MKLYTKFAIALTVLVALPSLAGAQTWTDLVNQPPQAVGQAVQLRDGRLLVNENQGPDAGQWFILTPDAFGSYVNGTWSMAGGHLQAGYEPIYFSSQVLLDGRHVIIEGGEYNLGNPVWTNLGAYATCTPFTGGCTWAANAPPPGWNSIGDAQAVLLANGKFLQANALTNQTAIFNGPNSWLAGGNILASFNDEAGWTLLPSGKVLTVDAFTACNSAQSSELYDPNTNTWSCGPTTPTKLYLNADRELGAAVLMYNNKVLQFGGAVVATNIYDVAANTWAVGPTPANGLNQADGPAALEPNGKVLAMLSPGLFAFGACQFVEYDPNTNTLANTANNAGCPQGSSFVGHLNILPTGQILFTDFGISPVSVYNPAPGVVAAAKPTILSASTNLTIGSTNNLLYGKQLNGLTQNNAYGDDTMGDTNYPLVRLTSASTGRVYYAFTHDDSTHSIAPNTIMFTKFDLPPTIPAGKYQLVAVANGIASNAITVSVK